MHMGVQEPKPESIFKKNFETNELFFGKWNETNKLHKSIERRSANAEQELKKLMWLSV